MNIDTYIVLDLEWNQNPDGKAKAIPGFPFEIIEIGAVKLDSDFQVIDRFSRIIKPVVYNRIHSKVYEIINKTIKELKKNGEPFKDACLEFFDWCRKDKNGINTDNKYIICTWGDMDLTELQKNMRYHNIDFKLQFPLLFYDIQKLYYKLYCKNTSDRPPLGRAVEELKIAAELPFHHALDDACYTVRIMQTMDFNSVKDYISVDYFTVPPDKESEVYLVFPDYSKYISRAFSSKDTALSDKTVNDMVCYKCKRRLHKKIRWFTSNQKHYYCLAACPEHGYVKGKIRIKSANEGYFIVKTVKIINSEAAEDIRRRKAELRKKRARHHNPALLTPSVQSE
jgi:exonuclease family protein